MGGGGGKFIIVDKGGGGGADVIGFVLIEGGGGMAVVGGRFISGFSWSGTFGPIRSLSSDGLESNSEHKVSSEHLQVEQKRKWAQNLLHRSPYGKMVFVSRESGVG